MDTYRITIVNIISQKKRRFNVEALNFNRAFNYAQLVVNHAFENIIKIELK